MTYELAKKLNEAGYPFEKHHRGILHTDGITPANYPHLSELIKACDLGLKSIHQEMNDRTPEGYLKFSGWKVIASDADDYHETTNVSLEEALAITWLKLMNKYIK